MKGRARNMEPLTGNTEGALESGNVNTKQQRIAELGKRMPDVGFTSLAYFFGEVKYDHLREFLKERVRDGVVSYIRLRSESIILRNRMR